MGNFGFQKSPNKMTLLVCGTRIPEIIQNKFRGINILDNLECETFNSHISLFEVKYCKIRNEDNQKIVEFSTSLYLQKIIIIYYSDINDNSNRDLDLIEKLSNTNEKFHPFIVFITGHNKERYINHLKQLQNYFDPLNIYCCEKYFNNELEKIIIGRGFYFYEKGNVNWTGNDISINLCVLGRPGAGKSTFINCIFEEKVAPEGTSENITSNITEYNFPLKIREDVFGSINIYDTPGFTLNGKTMENFEKFIDEKFKYFKQNHDYIHAFLYLFENRERTLEDSEIQLLKLIRNKQQEYSQNSIVLFLINNSQEGNENDPNSFKKKLLIHLENVFGRNSDYCLHPENIIELNLKSKNNKKKYGIEKVFEILYKFFEPNKIILPQREENESDEDFKEKAKTHISNSMFFKYIQSEESIYKRIEHSIDNLIKRFSENTKNLGEKGDIENIKNSRKEMLKEIKDDYNSNIKIFDTNQLDPKEVYDNWKKNIPFFGKYFVNKYLSEKSPQVTNDMGKKFKETHFNFLNETSSIEFVTRCIEYYNNSIEVIKQLSKKTTIDIKEKTYVLNDHFIIEFDIPFLNPSIATHNVQIIGENYLFKFEIKNPNTNEKLEPIVFLKKITEFQLQNTQRERLEKNNDNDLKSCKVKIFFSLRNEKNEVVED